MEIPTLTLEDFLNPEGARVVWNRFQSLLGQQVFRLRVERGTGDVSSSLCSLLSCDLSSPEGISQFDPNCMQPGHQQRNTNALEIDKQPLYGLPYIAQSTCPLLSLILLNIQELRSLDRYMDPCETIRRIKDIKRSLIDVHKKALLLESQLHQYINPTLVTTLNRRSAKATFEAELMCKLIDKLRKDSRQSASEPEKRKRVCELTMKLKALLCRQKCEWQCVGRLKETLAIARDMRGVLKFIGQLSCVLEHCSDASRRSMTERPPPYEYCSPYDSGSRQDSSDALYEDLNLIDDVCPPYESQSSHSQVTISLSLDFTSDKEFEGRSHSSDDSSRTRTSSYRHQSRSRSRTRDYSDANTDSGTGTLSSRRRTKDFTDVKSDSDAAATLSSRRRCRDYSFRIDSDGCTLSSKKRRKSRHDSKTPDEKSSKNHLRRAKSASSFSSRPSSRRQRKRYDDSDGSKSCQQTVPTSMEASDGMRDTPSYSPTSRSGSPGKMASPRDRLLSKKLAEKTINELIGVLEDYMENKSESIQRSVSRGSPGQTSYKSADASRSEPASRQTFHVDSSLQSETSPSKQWSGTSPKLPKRLSSTHNDLQDSHQSFSKDISSGQSHGWSTATPQKSEMRQSLKDSKRSPLSSRMSRQDLGDARLSHNSRKVSYQNFKEVKSGRNSLLEGRLSKQIVSNERTSSPESKSDTMSENLQDAPQEEIKPNKNTHLETTLSRQNFTDASSPDFKSSRMSKQIDLASISKNLQDAPQDEIKSGRKSLLETKLNKQNLSSARTSSLDFISSKQKLAGMRNSYDYIKTKESQENIEDANQMRSSQREMKSARSIKGSEWKRKSMEDVSDRASQRKTDPRKMTTSNFPDSRQWKPVCDQLRMSRKSVNENKLDETRGQKKSVEEHDLDKIRNEKNRCVVEISSAQMERQRQLARECADVVRRRIASMSPPPSWSKQAQTGKQLCASTSPPRVRRDIDIICGRFEKNSLVNSESTDSKNISELSTPSKRKTSKNIISPLSVISESKDYQSSNTEVQELEEDADTNNMEDISTNKNISDFISQTPREVKKSKTGDRCRHKRTTPTLLSKMSEDCKYYMQPRCDNSDSSGSRDPLLFSSQETGFSCDCDDDGSDLSYKISRAIKRRLKTSRSQRTRARKSSQDEVSDLLEDTTTTTDSCTYDEKTTSVPPRKSFSGRRQSSRAHQMDDTEGDIDKESDFEEELELKDSTDQFTDKESEQESAQITRRDRKSSVYPEKSESHHSSRSVSQSSQRSGSVNESSPRQRSSSPRQGSGQSRRQSSSRSSDYKQSGGRTPSLRQSGNDQYQQQPYMSPDKDQFKARDSLMQAGSSRPQTPRDETDLHASDSAKVSPSRQGSGQSRRQSSIRSSDYKQSAGRTPSLRQSGNDQYQPYMALQSDQFKASDGLMQADSSRPQTPSDETDLRTSYLAKVKSPALSETFEQAASLPHSWAGSRKSTGRSSSLNSAYQGEDSRHALEKSQMSTRSSIRPVQSLMESERPASLPRLRFQSGSRRVSNVYNQLQSPVHSVPTASSRYASSGKFASLEAEPHFRSPTHAPYAVSTHSAVSVRRCPCETSGRVHTNSCEMSGRVNRNPCEMSGRVHTNPCEMSGRVHTNPCEMSRRLHMNPCEMSGQVHRNPCEMAGQVHTNPCEMSGRVHTYPSIHGKPEYSASRVCSDRLYSTASRHGSHFLASEVLQMQPPSPGMSGRGASYVGSPTPIYPAGSIHSYHASKSEQPQMLSSPPGILVPGSRQTGSPALMYSAAPSVHEYLSSVMDPLQMATPELSPTQIYPADSFVAAYPAGSVQGDISAASEYSRQAEPQTAGYQTGSMQGIPSLISHQSQFLPARTSEQSSKQTVSQIRPTTPATLPPTAVRHSIDPSFASDSKPPLVFHLTPMASQQQSVGAASSASYPEAFAILGEAYRLRPTPGVSPPNSEAVEQHTFQQTQRVSHQSSQPQSESSAVVELSQMIQVTPRSSQQPPMRASSNLSYQEPSAVLDQPQMLQLTPRGSQESSLRAPSTLAHSESSVTLEQHQMLQISPGGSQHSSMRASSLPHPESSAVLEQRQRAQLTPIGSQQSSVRAPSSLPQIESSVVSGQPQSLQLTPGGSQQSSVRAPSSLPQRESSVVSGQPQSLQLTPGGSQQSSVRAPSSLPQRESSVVSDQQQILQLTPRRSQQSSVRAPSSLPQIESSVVSGQPQSLQLTPIGSQQSSVRAPSSLPQTESSVVSDQQQSLQLTPRGSQQSSVRAPSSSPSHPESNAVFVQRQIYQMSPSGPQQSSERSPSLLPYPAGSTTQRMAPMIPTTPNAGAMSERSSMQSARSDRSPGFRRTTEFSDQQEVARNSPVLTSLPEAHEFSEAQLYFEPTHSEVRQPRQSNISDTSRHMSFQPEMSGMSGRSPSPADFAASSEHLSVPSDYLYDSRHSPSKSVRQSSPQKSVTPEEAESSDYIHGERGHSTVRSSIARTSLPKAQTSSRDDQNGYIFEERESTLVALAASSTGRDEIKERWWLYFPLAIFGLLLLYYIICYMTSSGGCVGCRAPLPNIFFYLINSAINSVRLIHTTPPPV